MDKHRDGKNATELCLSRFQSLTGLTGTQIRSDSKSIDTAFEVVVHMYTHTGGERKSSPPHIGPKKGINKEYKVFFPEIFSKISGSKTQVFGFSRGSWRV